MFFSESLSEFGILFSCNEVNFVDVFEISLKLSVFISTSRKESKDNLKEESELTQNKLAGCFIQS